ncbi:hypothetical protein F4780DRAFT_378193 [Xylariomycetidae sp. FL0641]|nr:hypothetical protein F4780DRAFT_378193 [Xylariomycetidae sp. FL0641]
MARLTTLSPLAFLALLLSFFNLSVAATADDTLADAQELAARQIANAAAANTPECMNYAMVANLSTVAANTTLRSAFMTSSDMGTLASRTLLLDIMPELVPLMMDKQLNAKCGNLTAIAVQGVDANLTAGQVLGFPIKDFGGVDPGNINMIIVSFLFVFGMGGLWISL